MCCSTVLDMFSSVASSHIRTRHHAPETNRLIERFNESLKHEHLYREEITDAVALGEHVERFRQIYKGIRPPTRPWGSARRWPSTSPSPTHSRPQRLQET
jgi:hypothetical protein